MKVKNIYNHDVIVMGCKMRHEVTGFYPQSNDALITYL